MNRNSLPVSSTRYSSNEDFCDSSNTFHSLSEDSRESHLTQNGSEEEPDLPPELVKRKSTSVPDHITKYMIEAPLVNNEVHYRTIGNQACAELLQEVMFVSDFDIDRPNKRFKNNRWHYSHEEKGVTVMLKENTIKNLHSVLGIGIIEEPLDYVWDIIKNPSSRFHYDHLLKKFHIIDYVDEQTKVVQWIFEKTDCFIKQAREVIAVQSCRKYGNGYITAGKSVEHCQCPPSDTPRLKVHGSGFYLEPYNRKGKQKTKVTYLLQIEMSGLPSSLVNYVLKRQPLAIAYLRDVSG